MLLKDVSFLLKKAYLLIIMGYPYSYICINSHKYLSNQTFKTIFYEKADS
jgi:hypothetical protein